jgi:hypothetical protein
MRRSCQADSTPALFNSFKQLALSPRLSIGEFKFIDLTYDKPLEEEAAECCA